MFASRATRALCAVVVLGMSAGCALLDGDGLDEPTLTDTAAQQAATSLATALDDLGARFLVGDPATERLQVLRWEDDPAQATERLSEQLAMSHGASAFVRACAHDFERRSDAGTAVTLETRVTETEPLGTDEAGVDWVRVEIAQDETHDDGEVTSSATSYGIGVADGSVVAVRDLSGVHADQASAAGVTSAFVAAVASGDEGFVEDRVDTEVVSDQDVAALRAWLAAAGEYGVAELPAAQEGSMRVAYVVPEHGPLVRFDVHGGTARGSTPTVTWEIISAP
ncbi:MAG: hypothetical protein GX593_07670 [Actinomycetales bacterium]|nr:hypothetical protein [Actinomycetales bacterium]